MTDWCGGARHGSVWCCALAIVCVVSLCQLAHVADAQAYHFSKGWMPGRKRSSDDQLAADPGLAGARTRGALYGDTDRRSAAQMCAVKSQTYQLAVDILKARHISQLAIV